MLSVSLINQPQKSASRFPGINIPFQTCSMQYGHMFPCNTGEYCTSARDVFYESKGQVKMLPARVQYHNAVLQLIRFILCSPLQHQ